jgi:hypothetical protein
MEKDGEKREEPQNVQFRMIEDVTGLNLRVRTTVKALCRVAHFPNFLILQL